MFKILTIIISSIWFNSCSKSSENKSINDSTQINRNISYATEAYNFCTKNKFNQEFAILIDMKIHSGKNRLFLWDFNKKIVIDSGLCSHGCGKLAWGKDFSKSKPLFSNRDGSHLSALGKYKIGERGVSQWGIKVKYLLHGLEKSNENALVRTIVLHSWDDVNETEIYPDGAPEGWGCPAIANGLLERLDKKLQSSKKPVLLWIYQ